MPDNPTTASPLTRSAEVQKAIDALLTYRYGDDESLTYREAETVLAYIASLEARQPCVSEKNVKTVEASKTDNLEHQPKPQSDDGLLPHQAMLLIKGSMQAWAGVEMPPERVKDIEDVLAALSQAPVPTSGAVEVADQILDFYFPFMSNGLPYDLKQAAAIIQAAIDAAVEQSKVSPDA